MLALWTVHETAGDWHFRARPSVQDGQYLAECRRGPFETDMGLTEPYEAEVWFNWGDSPEDAIRRLKAEVFN